jgi:hypothetical protein
LKFPDGKKLYDASGAVAWYQGKAGGQVVWYVVKSPYKQASDVMRLIGDLPEGAADVKKGKGAALRSIQTITGEPPRKLMVDMGIMDVNIRYPLGKGKAGTILFTSDPKPQTKGNITIKKGSVKSIRVKKIGNQSSVVALKK